MRTRTFAAACLAMIVLLAPAAVAGTGLTGTGASFDGRASFTGEAAFYGAYGASPTSTVVALVSLTAATMDVEMYTQSRTYAGPQGEVPVLLPDQPDREVLALTDAVLWTEVQQPLFVMQAFLPGQESGHLHLETERARTTAMSSVLLEDGYARPPLPGERSQGGEGWLSRMHYPDPMVVGTLASADHNLTFTGDLVLELAGFVLAGSSKEGTFVIRADEETRESGVPFLVDHTRRMARLQLQDARLEVHLYGGDFRGQWGGDTVSAHLATGQMVLEGATGERDGRPLSNERTALPAPLAATLSPHGDRLAVDVEAHPEASVFMPAELRSGLLILALAAAAVVALAGGLWVAARRPPTLAQVEAALESQAYDRAAKLAGHLIRRRPHLEGAHVARAVALSRAGRPQQVIAELEPYLAAQAPSDGVLHYVLGRAYQELGQAERAAEAYEKAVHLTPSLLAEVTVPQAPRRENDAHAYA